MREARVEDLIDHKQGSMTVREYSLNFLKLSRYATSLVSNSRDEMSRLLTGIAQDLEEECREAMLHDIMVSRLMVHVQQVEESRKRKHTRVGNKSRQAEENFLGKSSTEIREKPRFKKGLFHQGELSSSKGRHDRNSEFRVKRNNEVDTSQERPPCRKCGKLHGGECMRGTNACYSCGKPVHMYEVRLPTRKALVPYLFVFVSIG
nr:uncharacterized protein LOC104645625 [Solanum lycopersicum]